MGKAVWLLVSSEASENEIHWWDAFSNVTILSQPHSGNWNEVFETVALFRFFQPSRLSFEPFTTESISLKQPHTLPFPAISIGHTDELTKLLETDLASFTTVSIETTTVCNRTCSYCPHSTAAAKNPTFMPEEIFFKIIDSLHDYVPSYSGIIVPSMYGEPLLDNRLESFITYARSKFPHARIELFTNGDFLTPEKFFSLRNSGVDHYSISQHTHEMSPRLTATLNTVKQSFTGRLPISICKMLEGTKLNRGGLIDVETPEQCSKMLYCTSAYPNLTFDYKGDAVLCCNDYQSVHTFGNIAEKSVREIWEESAYRRIRNKLILGFLPFPLCRVCMHH
jgi:hypothetical protein